MAIALTIVLWSFAAVLLLVGAAMVIPLFIEVTVQKNEHLRVSVALRPFGWLGPRIPLPVSRRSRDKKKKTPVKVRSKQGMLPRNPQRIMRPAARLLADIIQRVGVRSMVLDTRFGLGDPGQTGQLFGLFAPLLYGTAGTPHMQVNVEPVFDETVLTGRLELVLTLVPVRLLQPALRFGWHAFGPLR